MPEMLASPLFDDVLFPLEISRRSSVGPEFSTDIVETAAGYEYRNQNWADGRLRFDVAAGVRTGEQHALLVEFFRCRAGRARGFRFRDWSDHKSCGFADSPAATDQVLALGDGAEQFFELRKAYVSGPITRYRRITRPVAGSVTIALGGIVQAAPPAGVYSIDHSTGIVTFTDPPPVDVAISAGFLFDVPARFGIDRLEAVRVFDEIHQSPELPIVEIRE